MNRPRILIVDDDVEILELLHEQLATEGYKLEVASGVEDVRAAIGKTSFDLVVLDLTLPDGDGLDLCREMRSSGQFGWIIMLTARANPLDRVLGLELGADDYLTKPFEPRELIVRIRNLLNREERAAEVNASRMRFAVFGSWRLDMVRRRLVAADGTLVMLSATEFEILTRLVERPNETLSREELMPSREATASFDRVIDNQMSKIRQKLETPDGEKLIMTIRSQGYVLATSVRYEG